MRTKKAICLLAITMISTSSYQLLPVYATETQEQIMEDVETNFQVDKEVSLNIPDDYASCEFKLEFKEPGNYAAKVISDKESKSFDCSVIDDSTMTCEVTGLKAGAWKVQIHNLDNSGNVPVVKVTVAAKAESQSNVVDDIKVAKDIAGMKIYFKDDAICAEWTDDSIGSVNVKVVNLDTSQTIANENVTENKFECDLGSARNISVTVVPTTSAGISGAEQTYTYAVNNNPNAIVSFPSDEYINTDTVPVQVTMNDSYGIYVLDNDEVALEEDLQQAGEYTFDVPLNDGNNNIKFYIVDADGNMRSTSASYVKDTTPPEITFESDYDGITTNSATYTIAGTIKDYAAFTINEKNVDVTTDGSFSYDCALHEGENVIKVAASDVAGNTVNYDIKLTYVISKDNGFEKMYYMFVAILAMIIALLVKKHKNRRKKDAKHEIDEKESDDLDVNIDFDPDIDDFDIDLDENGEDENDKKKKGAFSLPKVKALPKLKRKTKKEKVSKEKKIQSSGRKKVDQKKLSNKYKYILIKDIFIIAGVVLFLHTGFVFSTEESDSMSPYLMTHDFVIGNRLAYKVRTPQRGDVVSFKKEVDGEKKAYCKRVIGLAGDEISFVDGYVFINGEKLDESKYLDEEIETNCNKTFIVPEDSCFVLGDNRASSYDSRFWESPYVPYDSLFERVIVKIPLHYLFK